MEKKKMDRIIREDKNHVVACKIEYMHVDTITKN
jgi:hypothetical protein